MGIFYMLFSFIDWAIYSLVSLILRLIIIIAHYNFFTKNIIGDFEKNVFIILSVLMLFKIVISAIQYLVNPDTFDDKDRGMAGILKKLVICVGLLVLIRPIFDYAMEIQSVVLDAIPKVIFGTDVDINEVGQMGENISLQTLQAFYSVQDGKNVNSKNEINSLSSFRANIDDGCSLFGGISKCTYSYTFILSTAAGVYMVFLLLSMGLDIAIRTIKMGIIRILAPIPISHYITSKDSLSKFGKLAVNVYVDLFIRLGIIYFVIYFVQKVLESMKDGWAVKIGNSNVAVAGIELAFIKIIIIFALIIFAQKAPKFITDVLGIEGAGEGVADMFKRAGGLFGTTLGTGRALYAARRNDKNELIKNAGYDPNSNEWRKLSGSKKREILRKAARESGGRGRRLAREFRSAGAALKNGVVESYAHNKGYKDVMSSTRSAAERSYGISTALDAKGVDRSDYRREIRNNRLGVESNFATSSLEIEGAKAISDSSKAALDYVHNNIGAKFSKVQFDEYGYQMAVSKIKGKIFIGNDPSGHAINVDVSDMSNTFERDAHGNIRLDINNRPIMKKGSYTLAGVIKGLQEVISDNTGRYTAQQKANAEGNLDALQGIADSFIVSNAQNSNIVGDANPAFLNIIQDASDNIGKYSGNTQFGKNMIELGKQKGILDDNGKVIPGKLGEWLALNKKEGQNAQISAKQDMDLASLAAKEIADKYDKKS